MWDQSRWFTCHHCRVQVVLLQSFNMSPAVIQVPKEGIKIVAGQEIVAGHGHFAAANKALKCLRKQGILLASVRKDKSLPGRTSWLLHPRHICSQQVLASPMKAILLCSRALQRPCNHTVRSTPLGSACPARVHYLPPSILTAASKNAHCTTKYQTRLVPSFPCDLHTIWHACCQPDHILPISSSSSAIYM